MVRIFKFVCNSLIKIYHILLISLLCDLFLIFFSWTILCDLFGFIGTIIISLSL
ncbi:hypothetical protein C1645_791046 [Glomus cerebriforme]|uniref:Uncharacterized protein n=1 Tax=Glomus cerebriforme TaxID=658196 RepID=A0A397S582_9GLOM|nr:hypothetical protein C1645_791046 [Glomus cerebriforme]